MSRHFSIKLPPTHLPTFQSRAGFSECLDVDKQVVVVFFDLFQSRAGFSECLDSSSYTPRTPPVWFQSRAGFSECLDPRCQLSSSPISRCFNPVLGFLSVSTISTMMTPSRFDSFNPVLGFLSVSTGGEYTVIGVKSLSQCSKSNPRYVDWGCTET